MSGKVKEVEVEKIIARMEYVNSLPPHPAPVEYHCKDGVDYLVYGRTRRHEMTRKEWIEYTRKVGESEGYDMECHHNCVSLGGIEPMDLQVWSKYMELLIPMATLALHKYNLEKGTRLEHKEVKKANREYADGLKHYITFDVVDLDDHADPTKVFQVRSSQHSRRVVQGRPDSPETSYCVEAVV